MTSEVRHVLVVDDDELLREVAKASLELVAGWKVSLASSGAQARALAEAEQPDAIVLDVMMPGTDGPTTLSDLKGSARTRDIPVVFLTAKNDHSSWAGQGHVGVIAKPFDAMTLARDIATLLGWSF